MNSVSKDDSIEAIIAAIPASISVFERMNIDYCCGGKVSLASACASRGLAIQDVLKALNADSADSRRTGANPSAKPTDPTEGMSASQLVDFIETTHHAFLWGEMDVLKKLTAKVAMAHGGSDSRLFEVRERFMELAAELTSHMLKEEQVLFPLIRRIEDSEAPFLSPCGSVANPIRKMDADHDDAVQALMKLRELTDGFTPPHTACFSYRSMLTGLERMEEDLREHIRKETEVLFPKVVQLEKEKFPVMA